MRTTGLKISMLCCVLLTFCGAGYGAPPEISARLSTDSIAIGDQFSLTVTVKKDIMQVTEFPSFRENMMTEGIMILQQSPIDTLSRNGRELVLSRSYLLTSFTPGEHAIGRFPVFYLDKNITDTIPSRDSLHLTVTTIPVDLQNDTINDIKRPENAPFTGYEIFGYFLVSLLGLSVVVSAVYLLVRYLRNRKTGKTEGAMPAAVKEPPHLRAIRSLEELHNHKLWQGNRHKQYYTRLADIMREYLDGRYGIAAMEMTSEEIFSATRALPLMKKNRDELTELLTTADLVKFAKFVPAADDNEKFYFKAYYFVENTKETTAEEDNVAPECSATTEKSSSASENHE